MSDGFWLAFASIIIACMWFDVPIEDTFLTIISFWWVFAIVFGFILAVTFLLIVIAAIFNQKQ